MRDTMSTLADFSTSEGCHDSLSISWVHWGMFSTLGVFKVNGFHL